MGNQKPDTGQGSEEVTDLNTDNEAQSRYFAFPDEILKFVDCFS